MVRPTYPRFTRSRRFRSIASCHSGLPYLNWPGFPAVGRPLALRFLAIVLGPSWGSTVRREGRAVRRAVQGAPAVPPT
jgi:hypothetical protein